MDRSSLLLTLGQAFQSAADYRFRTCGRGDRSKGKRVPVEKPTSDTAYRFLKGLDVCRDGAALVRYVSPRKTVKSFAALKRIQTGNIGREVQTERMDDGGRQGVLGDTSAEKEGLWDKYKRWAVVGAVGAGLVAGIIIWLSRRGKGGDGSGLRFEGDGTEVLVKKMDGKLIATLKDMEADVVALLDDPLTAGEITGKLKKTYESLSIKDVRTFLESHLKDGWFKYNKDEETYERLLQPTSKTEGSRAVVSGVGETSSNPGPAVVPVAPQKNVSDPYAVCLYENLGKLSAYGITQQEIDEVTRAIDGGVGSSLFARIPYDRLSDDDIKTVVSLVKRHRHSKELQRSRVYSSPQAQRQQAASPPSAEAHEGQKKVDYYALNLGKLAKVMDDVTKKEVVEALTKADASGSDLLEKLKTDEWTGDEVNSIVDLLRLYRSLKEQERRLRTVTPPLQPSVPAVVSTSATLQDPPLAEEAISADSIGGLILDGSPAVPGEVEEKAVDEENEKILNELHNELYLIAHLQQGLNESEWQKIHSAILTRKFGTFYEMEVDEVFKEYEVSEEEFRRKGLRGVITASDVFNLMCKESSKANFGLEFADAVGVASLWSIMEADWDENHDRQIQEYSNFYLDLAQLANGKKYEKKLGEQSDYMLELARKLEFQVSNNTVALATAGQPDFYELYMSYPMAFMFMAHLADYLAAVGYEDIREIIREFMPEEGPNGLQWYEPSYVARRLDGLSFEKGFAGWSEGYVVFLNGLRDVIKAQLLYAEGPNIANGSVDTRLSLLREALRLADSAKVMTEKSANRTPSLHKYVRRLSDDIKDKIEDINGAFNRDGGDGTVEQSVNTRDELLEESRDEGRTETLPEHVKRDLARKTIRTTPPSGSGRGSGGTAPASPSRSGAPSGPPPPPSGLDTAPPPAWKMDFASPLVGQPAVTPMTGPSVAPWQVSGFRFIR